MGMDNNIYCGVYIRFDGTLGGTHKTSQFQVDILDEALCQLRSEGEFDNDNDYWIPNKTNRPQSSIRIPPTEPIEINHTSINVFLNNFEKGYIEEITKLAKFYHENGIKSYHIVFGIISTWN